MMDDIIKEIYMSSVKTQEREIDIIKNRLDFINWLFGVASTLLFAAVVAARSSSTNNSVEDFIIASIGFFAFLTIMFTFFGKLQGYNSIQNRIQILTLLDVQKLIFLAPNPPESNPIIFSNFGYLPEKMMSTYLKLDAYTVRKTDEITWIVLMSISVIISLGAMLWLLIESSIK